MPAFGEKDRIPPLAFGEAQRLADREPVGEGGEKVVRGRAVGELRLSEPGVPEVGRGAGHGGGGRSGTDPEPAGPVPYSSACVATASSCRARFEYHAMMGVTDRPWMTTLAAIVVSTRLSRRSENPSLRPCVSANMR